MLPTFSWDETECESPNVNQASRKIQLSSAYQRTGVDGMTCKFSFSRKETTQERNAQNQDTYVLNVVLLLPSCRSKVVCVYAANCWEICQSCTIGIGISSLVVRGCICFCTAFTAATLAALAALLAAATDLLTLSSTFATSYAFSAARRASWE